MTVAREYHQKQLEPVCEARDDSSTTGEKDTTTTCTSTDPTPTETTNQEDHVRFFVVSATEGLLDYLAPEAIAFQLAKALYEGSGKHPMVAASDLLHESSGL